MTNLAQIQAAPNTQTQPNGGVTELVLASDSPESLALLLPMIAYLSCHSGNRWVTWVAPHQVTRQKLEDYGVDTTHLRLIHTTHTSNPLWIIWEALAAGNSHTVIASPGKLSEKELRQLEVAALKGQSQGLLLRIRQ